MMSMRRGVGNAFPTKDSAYFGGTESWGFLRLKGIFLVSMKQKNISYIFTVKFYYWDR